MRDPLPGTTWTSVHSPGYRRIFAKRSFDHRECASEKDRLHLSPQFHVQRIFPSYTSSLVSLPPSRGAFSAHTTPSLRSFFLSSCFFLFYFLYPLCAAEAGEPEAEGGREEGWIKVKERKAGFQLERATDEQAGFSSAPGLWREILGADTLQSGRRAVLASFLSFLFTPGTLLVHLFLSFSRLPPPQIEPDIIQLASLTNSIHSVPGALDSAAR